MLGADGEAVVAAVVGSVLVTIGVVASFRREAGQLPAGIVRRLYRTGRPVTVVLRGPAMYGWDPSRPHAYRGFNAPGTVMYSLELPATIRVRFAPQSGSVIERTATIPRYLLPDLPETHRRRMFARAVIAIYLAVGLAAFILTAHLVGGSGSLRFRSAALAALGSVAISWLATHFVLTRHRRQPVDGSGHPPLLHARRLVEWIAGYAVVSSALAVAWQLGSRDETHPASWANAFLSAGIFVLATAAALAASLHHHTYIHHTDHPQRAGV